MAFRVNSKQERKQILLLLTEQLIETKCTDLKILKQVDRLCRRTWSDLNRGWISWAFYLEKILGPEEYKSWARDNCRPITSNE